MARTEEQACDNTNNVEPIPFLLTAVPPAHRHRRRHSSWIVPMGASFLVGWVLGMVVIIGAWNVSDPSGVRRFLRLPTTVGQRQLDDFNKEEENKTYCEATVILLRHCEKVGPMVVDEEGNQHCSYLGKLRNEYIATLFGTRWPMPTHLYAMSHHRKSHENFRQEETLTPLSKKTGLKIRSDTKKTRVLANTILKQLYHDGCQQQVMVVSWKHSDMIDLGHALGWAEAPNKYPKSSFDNVWVLKYVYGIEDDTPMTSFAEEDERDSQEQTDIEDEDESDDFDDIDKDLDEGEVDGPWKKNHHNSWTVYGSATQQYFDPVAFTYSQERKRLGLS